MFNCDVRSCYTMYQLEGFVLNYATAHHGMANRCLTYDEALWSLFDLSAETPFKIHHIIRIVRAYLDKYTLVCFCPVCSKKVQHPYRIKNSVCHTCCTSPDLLDSNHNVACAPFSFGESYWLNGIECRRDDWDVHRLHAIGRCPICKDVVEEIGAFCNRCSSSEWLADSNGNRVQFELADWKEIGFRCIHYEKGEIVTRLHVGPYPCFFQGVPCVADDYGRNEHVVVRFLKPTDREWKHIWLPAPSVQTRYDENSSVPPTDSDWLNNAYPRWAPWELLESSQGDLKAVAEDTANEYKPRTSACCVGRIDWRRLWRYLGIQK